MAFFDWNNNGKKDIHEDMIEYYILNEVSKNNNNDNNGSNPSLLGEIFTWCTIGFFGLLSLFIDGKGRKRGAGGIGLALLCGFFVMKGLGALSASLTQCLGVAAAANVAGGLAVKDKISARCGNTANKISGGIRGGKTASTGSSGASIGSSGASIGSSGASTGSSGASTGSSGASTGSSSINATSSEKTTKNSEEKILDNKNNIQEKKTTIVSNYSNVSIGTKKKAKKDKEKDENEKRKIEKQQDINNDSIQDEKTNIYKEKNNYNKGNIEKKELDIKEKHTYKYPYGKEKFLHKYEIKPLLDTDMKKLIEEMEEESKNMEYYDTVLSAVNNTLEHNADTFAYKKIMIERIKDKGISQCPAIMWADKGDICVCPLIKGGKTYRWNISDIDGIYFQKRINPDIDREFYHVGISKIIDEFEELLPTYPFGEEGVYTWKYIVDDELEVTNSSGEAIFEMIGKENIEVRSQIEMFKEMGML